MAKQKKSHGAVTTKDYETLGRELESIFEGGYIDHKRVYKINFIRGLFFGLGSILGGTLLLAFLLWLLTLANHIPLIGEIAETIQNSIQEKP